MAVLPKKDLFGEGLVYDVFQKLEQILYLC